MFSVRVMVRDRVTLSVEFEAMVTVGFKLVEEPRPEPLAMVSPCTP